MPYEPFLLGVGVVFNLLMHGLSKGTHQILQCTPSVPLILSSPVQDTPGIAEDLVEMESQRLSLFLLGSQHPSPNVKSPLLFKPQIWLEIITARDAKKCLF